MKHSLKGNKAVRTECKRLTCEKREKWGGENITTRPLQCRITEMLLKDNRIAMEQSKASGEAFYTPQWLYFTFRTLILCFLTLFFIIRGRFSIGRQVFFHYIYILLQSVAKNGVAFAQRLSRRKESEAECVPVFTSADRIEMLISCRSSSVSVWNRRMEEPSENAIHTPPPAHAMWATLTVGSGWTSNPWEENKFTQAGKGVINVSEIKCFSPH